MFRPLGLTALQYTALTVLERYPNLTSAQLARSSFVTAQTMAHMVNTLRERGYLERLRDAEDRRRLVLSLTTQGRRLVGRSRGKVAALEAEMLAGLTKSQATELRHSLLICRTALAPHPPSKTRRPHCVGHARNHQEPVRTSEPSCGNVTTDRPYRPDRDRCRSARRPRHQAALIRPDASR
jgi:DNA-binding MarR family transcriptional regulator